MFIKKYIKDLLTESVRGAILTASTSTSLKNSLELGAMVTQFAYKLSNCSTFSFYRLLLFSGNKNDKNFNITNSLIILVYTKTKDKRACLLFSNVTLSLSFFFFKRKATFLFLLSCREVRDTRNRRLIHDAGHQ